MGSWTEAAPRPGWVPERERDPVPLAFPTHQSFCAEARDAEDGAPKVLSPEPAEVPTGPPLWVGPVGGQARPPGAELGLLVPAAPWSRPAPSFRAAIVRAPAPLPQSKSGSTFSPTSKTRLLAGTRKGKGGGDRLGALGPARSPPPPGCGLSAGSICSWAGALSQPPAASPPLPAAWEIFPMEACPSPPCFNKSVEEGQGIPPSSSYTSQPVPHLLFPPSLARPGKAAGSQVLAGGGVGAQPMPSPAATPSFIQTGKQGAPAGGNCPSACVPGAQ